MLIIYFQWIAPECEKSKQANEQMSVDLGDEYEQALSGASQEEIIDLAGKKNNYPKFCYCDQAKGSMIS
jgi:hypothetical protein